MIGVVLKLLTLLTLFALLRLFVVVGTLFFFIPTCCSALFPDDNSLDAGLSFTLRLVSTFPLVTVPPAGWMMLLMLFGELMMFLMLFDGLSRLLCEPVMMYSSYSCSTFTLISTAWLANLLFGFLFALWISLPACYSLSWSYEDFAETMA